MLFNKQTTEVVDEVVIAKLVSGEFIVGTLRFDEITKKEYFDHCYGLSLRQIDNMGNVSPIIHDYMAPFSNDGKGVSIEEYQVISYIIAPKEISDGYIHKKTGIMPATSMPNSKLQIVR
jgi:hypothetical protein